MARLASQRQTDLLSPAAPAAQDMPRAAPLAERLPWADAAAAIMQESERLFAAAEAPAG